MELVLAFVSQSPVLKLYMARFSMKIFQNISKKSKFSKMQKNEKFEISHKNRKIHEQIAQKTIVFERGELKYRVSGRGKNVPSPDFHSECLEIGKLRENAHKKQ